MTKCNDSAQGPLSGTVAAAVGGWLVLTDHPLASSKSLLFLGPGFLVCEKRAREYGAD